MIPKLIHFVWIGDDELPDWVVGNIATFTRHNPDHQVMVHRDASLVPPEMRGRFDACDRYCTQSDIIRWYILREHGGWYIDTDVVCLRPLDEIVAAYDLDPLGARLFSIEVPYSGSVLIDCAVMACQPGAAAVDYAISLLGGPPDPERDRHVCRYGMLPIEMLRLAHPDWLVAGRWPDFCPSTLGYVRMYLADLVRCGESVPTTAYMIHESHGMMTGRRRTRPARPSPPASTSSTAKSAAGTAPSASATRSPRSSDG